jgi:hypothetical protein
LQRYLCPKCQGVFCGWAVSDKCPNCGGKLREVYSNNKTGNKKLLKDPIAKILKLRKNLRSGNL